MRELLKRSQFLTGLANAVRSLPGDAARLKWTMARGGKIARYFATEAKPRLQIGCGKNVLPGWLNCDFDPGSEPVVFLDATGLYPFPDRSFDFIFSEHMIEHVPYAAGQRMLRECHRVLKPGGVIRISTPNLRSVAALMSSEMSPEKDLYIKTSTDKYIPANTRYLPGFVLNNFYWDFWHYFIYDPDTIKQALESAGFADIRQVSSGVSAVPELSGLECHAKVVGETLDQLESMIFEATRGA